MKTIRRRLYIYAGTAALGVTAFIFLLINPVVSGCPAPVQLLPAITAVLLAAGLAVREYGRLKTALLIVENQILHIRPAVIDAAETEDSAASSIEVFISCFGILLDSRIIKFNQDGIRLKAVEFRRDFISLTYGTDKRVQNTRLIHAAIDSGELVEIMEKFRYETGITPVITKQ